MAGIGVKKPQIADYKNNGGTVSHENHAIIGEAIEWSVSIKSSDDNNLYGDDEVSETDKSFESGEMELNTTDLSQEVSQRILGLHRETLSIEVDGDNVDVDDISYGDADNPPDLGFGIMIPKKVHGQRMIRAIFLPRIKFIVPEDAAKTRAGKIEWQTPKVKATIMRADDGLWKRETTVDNEKIAQAYFDHFMGSLEQGSGAGLD